VRLDGYTLPAVLKACAPLEGIGEGRQAHAVAAKAWVPRATARQERTGHALRRVQGCEEGVRGNGGAGRLVVFLKHKDVVLWTVLFSAFARGGRFAEALRVFAEMDVAPNEVTLVTVLRACGRLGR